MLHYALKVRISDNFTLFYQGPNMGLRFIMESQSDSAHSDSPVSSLGWLITEGEVCLLKATKIWPYNNLMLNVWLSNESHAIYT